jgi:CheY-like chemotaxis protein
MSPKINTPLQRDHWQTAALSRAWLHLAAYMQRPRTQLRGWWRGLAAPSARCPRQDSNLRTRLRRPLLYPLSYGGDGKNISRLGGVGVYGVSRGRRGPGEGCGWVRGSLVAGKKWAKRGRIATGAPTLLGVTGASGRVLVVDDNKVIRQLIRVNLELEGFEVVTAADGAECLEIVHTVRPDVVTLDVVMPRLDGVRTAARLRADERTRQVGIVMVTAGNLPESAGGPGGVDAYVAKPFEPEQLVETVRRLVRRGPLPPEQSRGQAAAAPGA